MRLTAFLFFLVLSGCSNLNEAQSGESSCSEVKFTSDISRGKFCLQAASFGACSTGDLAAASTALSYLLNAKGDNCEKNIQLTDFINSSVSCGDIAEVINVNEHMTKGCAVNNPVFISTCYPPSIKAITYAIVMQKIKNCPA